MLNYRIDSSWLVERAGLDRGKRAGSTSGQINTQGLKVNEDEDSGFIERFHSRGHCWNQKSAYIRKKFNSHGIGLEHQQRRRDVIWKRSLSPIRNDVWSSISTSNIDA